MNTKVFAIGMKGWVELRAAATAPKAVKSQVTKKLSSKEGYFTPGGAYKTRPATLKIHVLVYEGGKVLGAVSSRKFCRVTKQGLPDGQLREIPHEMAKHLLAKR